MGLKVSAELVRPQQLATFLSKLDSPVIQQAAARGLSEHADEQRLQSITRIQAYTGVPKGRISGKTRTHRASPGPNMVAMVENKDQAISLGEYGKPVWMRSMAGAEATAWNRRQVFEGTFVAKGEVFKRKGAGRLPLEKLYGPVIPNELSKPSRPNVPAATRFAALDMEKRITRMVLVALGT